MSRVQAMTLPSVQALQQGCQASELHAACQPGHSRWTDDYTSTASVHLLTRQVQPLTGWNERLLSFLLLPVITPNEKLGRRKTPQVTAVLACHGQDIG